MPNVEIRETIVTPDANGALVQLQISDVPPPYEGAAILLTLAVRVPEFRSPLIAHIQHEAVLVADDTLRDLAQRLLQEVDRAHYPLRPELKSK